MSAEELRRQVGWTVEDPSPAVRAGWLLGAVFHLASTVATFGADAGGDARRPGWTLPADPSGYLDLGRVTLWLPADAPSVPVQATRTGVWATPSGRPPRPLPVQGWRVLRAVPAGSVPRRHPEAEWLLTVTDGTVEGTLSGAWLALAWIGHVAGWPEPVT